jgi:hypothetical protein
MPGVSCNLAFLIPAASLEVLASLGVIRVH